MLCRVCSSLAWVRDPVQGWTPCPSCEGTGRINGPVRPEDEPVILIEEDGNGESRP